jgi:hypothetical protein
VGVGAGAGFGAGAGGRPHSPDHVGRPGWAPLQFGTPPPNGPKSSPPLASIALAQPVRPLSAVVQPNQKLR